MQPTLTTRSRPAMGIAARTRLVVERDEQRLCTCAAIALSAVALVAPGFAPGQPAHRADTNVVGRLIRALREDDAGPAQRTAAPRHAHGALPAGPASL